MKLVPAKTVLAIWKALPPKLGSVVGEEATLTGPDLAREWSPTGTRYYAALELVEPRAGTLWMSFSLSLAIASAGHLVMRPKSAIRSNIESSTFDGDDLDAMGECVNTFCAALNEALRAELGQNHRVVFRSGTLEAPDASDAGPLSVARGRLELGELAKGDVELVIPDAVFVAATELDEDSRDEDEDEDVDDGEEAATADEGDSGGAVARAAKKDRGGRRRAKGSKARPVDAGEDAAGLRWEDSDDPTAGPLLSREELAAIRGATAPMGGLAVVVADLASARERWRSSLENIGVGFELAANAHQVLALCRARKVDVVVVDADACSSGGLSILAAIRGATGVPARRVVIASAATRSHLVSCFASGASDYLTRPIDDNVLASMLESG